jgi:hypothetical protein
MTSRKRFSIVWPVSVLVIGWSAFVLAQTAGTGGYGGPIYDTKAETTIKGTVENVETFTGTGGRGRHALAGTHLTVKTDVAVFDVHLGPTAYLAEKGITVAKGDVLEILGSRVTINDAPVVIARQITKGENTWTLRDASGRPLWSGRGR